MRRSSHLVILCFLSVSYILLLTGCGQASTSSYAASKPLVPVATTQINMSMSSSRVVIANLSSTSSRQTTTFDPTIVEEFVVRLPRSLNYANDVHLGSRVRNSSPVKFFTLKVTDTNHEYTTLTISFLGPMSVVTESTDGAKSATVHILSVRTQGQMNVTALLS